MKPTLRQSMNMLFTLAIAFNGARNCPAATASQTGLAITIHVRNYAGLEPQTLALAEHTASEILQKAGVETGWVEIPLPSQASRSIPSEHPPFTLADIQLTICPDFMSDRFNLPGNVMGLTPGTGRNRGVIYVFDGKAAAMSLMTLAANSRGEIPWFIPRGRMLGHAIAHELGHLLLNQPGHSDRGLMRGEWGLPEMRDAAFGELLFTPQEAKVIQTEVRRRSERQETAKAH